MDLKKQLLAKDMDLFTRQLFEFFIESIERFLGKNSETFVVKALNSQKKPGKVEIKFVRDELDHATCTCLGHNRDMICEHMQIALTAIEILTDRQPDLDQEAIEEMRVIMLELSELNKDKLLNLIADVLSFSEETRMAFLEQLFFRLSLDQKRMFEIPEVTEERKESKGTNVIQFPFGGPSASTSSTSSQYKRVKSNIESQKEVGPGLNDLSGIDLEKLGNPLSFYKIYSYYEHGANVQGFDDYYSLEETAETHINRMLFLLHNGEVDQANPALLHTFLYIFDGLIYAENRKEYAYYLKHLIPLDRHPLGQALTEVFLDELTEYFPRRRALHEEMKPYRKKS